MARRRWQKIALPKILPIIAALQRYGFYRGLFFRRSFVKDSADLGPRVAVSPAQTRLDSESLRDSQFVGSRRATLLPG
jgi:hypothetical protein